MLRRYNSRKQDILSQELITVAICTYHRYPLLKNLVAALGNQSLPRAMFRILVVDNTDDEQARQLYLKEAQGTPCLEVAYSFPPGLSRARNMAIEKCRTEFIVFIDDDALPSPAWLSALLAGFEQSGASVVAGPIEPVWPTPKPEWVPDKYIGCLTVLDHGPKDRVLSAFEFAYGTNMAFRASALRDIGGFDLGLGRVGSKTLISDEEIQTQLALQRLGHSRFYSAEARVSHLVHENRMSRNYFRSRMAWQAVSTLMHDSPLWWLEQSRQEVIRTAGALGVGDLFQRLLTYRDAETLSAQIDLIYHLFLVILNSNNESDDAFESPFLQASPAAVFTPVAAALAPTGAETPYLYRPAEPISMDTRHLFVDSPSSHAFLFDAYADIPGAQLVSFRGNLWDRCDEDIGKLYRSLGSQIETLTFMTLEPLLFGLAWESFHALLNCVRMPVFGILHRLPWTEAQAELLRDVAKRMQIIVLAESMADRLRADYGVPNVLTLPLHATHSIYLGLDPSRTQEAVGLEPGQLVFSVLGEARKGKGIEILLEALPYISVEDRQRMFFLFGGRAKDFDPETVKGQLEAAGCSGFVDLRRSGDPLHYAVLTERELGDYINITDVGVLLYQEDQRNCMSGVLPNYVWGRKPVIATSNSIVGNLVQKHGLGIALGEETPQQVAHTLSMALEACGSGQSWRYVNEVFRAATSPSAVVRQFAAILAGTKGDDSGAVQRFGLGADREKGAISLERYLSDLPMLHTWDDGKTWNSGGFMRQHLEPLVKFMVQQLPPHPLILETGAGNSTIAFLFLSPKQLVSIAPEAPLYERIRAYCLANEISSESLISHVGFSQWVLPGLAARMPERGVFDFILIDGIHNWPMVFVDFFYCNYMLRPGGYIMIDDLQIHSIRELARMLVEQPGFELVLDIGKSMVFRRTTELRALGEWNTLPYVLRKTNEYMKRENPFSLDDLAQP